MTTRTVGHRQNTAQRLRTARDWLIALLLVAAVTVAAAVLSEYFFDRTKEDRLAADRSGEIRVDSIYSDRIEGAYDTHYDRTRYQAIAKSLETDPVYFDGYPEFEIVEADIAAIRTEIADADPLVFVAFLNASGLDDADGDLDVLAARIVTEMDDAEVVVLTVDAQGAMGLGEKGVARPDLLSLYGEFRDPDSRSALVGVREVMSAKTVDLDSNYSYRHDDDGNPLVVKREQTAPRELEYSIGGAVAGSVFGIIVGAGAGVGIVLIRRAIAKRTETK